MNKIVRNFLIVWLVIGMLFFTIFSIVNDESNFTMLYYFLWIFVVGSFVYKYKDQIQKKLTNWKLNNFVKFIILGYLAILSEELIAAFVNHLSEGFEVMLFLQRISQFWAFNILTFTGFIFGWYFLTKYVNYSKTEIFFLAGLWGLWAEQVIFLIVANPIGFLLWFPIIVFTYGLIITPAMLSLKNTGKKELNPILKYLLTYVVLFIFSIPPIALLLYLIENYRGLFPPSNFVPI